MVVLVLSLCVFIVTLLVLWVKVASVTPLYFMEIWGRAMSVPPPRVIQLPSMGLLVWSANRMVSQKVVSSVT